MLLYTMSNIWSELFELAQYPIAILLQHSPILVFIPLFIHILLTSIPFWIIFTHLKELGVIFPILLFTSFILTFFQPTIGVMMYIILLYITYEKCSKYSISFSESVGYTALIWFLIPLVSVFFLLIYTGVFYNLEEVNWSFITDPTTIYLLDLSQYLLGFGIGSFIGLAISAPIFGLVWMIKIGIQEDEYDLRICAILMIILMIIIPALLLIYILFGNGDPFLSNLLLFSNFLTNFGDIWGFSLTMLAISLGLLAVDYYITEMTHKKRYTNQTNRINRDVRTNQQRDSYATNTKNIAIGKSFPEYELPEQLTESVDYTLDRECEMMRSEGEEKQDIEVYAIETGKVATGKDVYFTYKIGAGNIFRELKLKKGKSEELKSCNPEQFYTVSLPQFLESKKYASNIDFMRLWGGFRSGRKESKNYHKQLSELTSKSTEWLLTNLLKTIMAVSDASLPKEKSDVIAIQREIFIQACSWPKKFIAIVAGFPFLKLLNDSDKTSEQIVQESIEKHSFVIHCMNYAKILISQYNKNFRYLVSNRKHFSLLLTEFTGIDTLELDNIRADFSEAIKPKKYQSIEFLKFLNDNSKTSEQIVQESIEKYQDFCISLLKDNDSDSPTINQLNGIRNSIPQLLTEAEAKQIVADRGGLNYDQILEAISQNIESIEGEIESGSLKYTSINKDMTKHIRQIVHILPYMKLYSRLEIHNQMITSALGIFGYALSQKLGFSDANAVVLKPSFDEITPLIHNLDKFMKEQRQVTVALPDCPTDFGKNQTDIDALKNDIETLIALLNQEYANLSPAVSQKIDFKSTKERYLSIQTIISRIFTEFSNIQSQLATISQNRIPPAKQKNFRNLISPFIIEMNSLDDMYNKGILSVLDANGKVQLDIGSTLLIELVNKIYEFLAEFSERVIGSTYLTQGEVKFTKTERAELKVLSEVKSHSVKSDDTRVTVGIAKANKYIAEIGNLFSLTKKGVRRLKGLEFKSTIDSSDPLKNSLKRLTSLATMLDNIGENSFATDLAKRNLRYYIEYLALCRQMMVGNIPSESSLNQAMHPPSTVQINSGTSSNKDKAPFKIDVEFSPEERPFANLVQYPYYVCNIHGSNKDKTIKGLRGAFKLKIPSNMDILRRIILKNMETMQAYINKELEFVVKYPDLMRIIQVYLSIKSNTVTKLAKYEPAEFIEFIRGEFLRVEEAVKKAKEEAVKKAKGEAVKKAKDNVLDEYLKTLSRDKLDSALAESNLNEYLVNLGNNTGANNLTAKFYSERLSILRQYQFDIFDAFSIFKKMLEIETFSLGEGENKKDYNFQEVIYSEELSRAKKLLQRFLHTCKKDQDDESDEKVLIGNESDEKVLIIGDEEFSASINTIVKYLKRFRANDIKLRYSGCMFDLPQDTSIDSSHKMQIHMFVPNTNEGKIYFSALFKVYPLVKEKKKKEKKIEKEEEEEEEDGKEFPVIVANFSVQSKRTDSLLYELKDEIEKLGEVVSKNELYLGNKGIHFAMYNYAGSYGNKIIKELEELEKNPPIVSEIVKKLHPLYNERLIRATFASKEEKKEKESTSEDTYTPERMQYRINIAKEKLDKSFRIDELSEYSGWQEKAEKFGAIEEIINNFPKIKEVFRDYYQFIKDLEQDPSNKNRIVFLKYQLFNVMEYVFQKEKPHPGVDVFKLIMYPSLKLENNGDIVALIHFKKNGVFFKSLLKEMDSEAYQLNIGVDPGIRTSLTFASNFGHLFPSPYQETFNYGLEKEEECYENLLRDRAITGNLYNNYRDILRMEGKIDEGVQDLHDSIERSLKRVRGLQSTITKNLLEPSGFESRLKNIVTLRKMRNLDSIYKRVQNKHDDVSKKIYSGIKEVLTYADNEMRSAANKNKYNLAGNPIRLNFEASGSSSSDLTRILNRQNTGWERGMSLNLLNNFSNSDSRHSLNISPSYYSSQRCSFCGCEDKRGYFDWNGKEFKLGGNTKGGDVSRCTNPECLFFKKFQKFNDALNAREKSPLLIRMHYDKNRLDFENTLLVYLLLEDLYERNNLEPNRELEMKTKILAIRDAGDAQKRRKWKNKPEAEQERTQWIADIEREIENMKASHEDLTKILSGFLLFNRDRNAGFNFARVDNRDVYQYNRIIKIVRSMMHPWQDAVAWKDSIVKYLTTIEDNYKKWEKPKENKPKPSEEVAGLIRNERDFVMSTLAKALLQVVDRKEREINEKKKPEDRKILIDVKQRAEIENKIVRNIDDEFVKELLESRKSPHKLIMAARQANRPGGFAKPPAGDAPSKKGSPKKKPPLPEQEESNGDPGGT
jgi:hypothetical protein